jgi:hypothetical protein
MLKRINTFISNPKSMRRRKMVSTPRFVRPVVQNRFMNGKTLQTPIIIKAKRKRNIGIEPHLFSAAHSRA